jgi:hypothetical protein
MPKISRRFFLLSTAALPIGCSSSRRQPELTSPSPTVRQPVVGQSWRYAKHDLFTGALVAIQDEQIASHIKSKCRTSDEAGLPWAQTMKAEA